MAAMEKWREETSAEFSRYIGTYAGSGVFTFALFWKFERALSWGMMVPLPAQLGYPDTPKNRDIWAHNVSTIYDAALVNDLRIAAPLAYEELHVINVGDVPVYIEKKKSLISKIVKGLAVVAVVAIGAMVIAGALAGTAAGATATAAGGTSAVASASGAAIGGTTIGTATATATVATASGGAIVTTATATYGGTSLAGSIAAAAKSAGAWILKTAASASVGQAIQEKAAEKLQEQQAAEQKKLEAAQQAAIASDLAEIEAMKAEIARRQQAGASQPSSGWAVPVGIVGALLALFM